MPPWANGKNGKEYAATLGNKAIGRYLQRRPRRAYRWKDSVQSGDEIRLWVADGSRNDLRPWFTKFNAKPIDKRWLPVVEKFYDWHHRNEKYLRNEGSLAEVAMVYSQQTARFHGRDVERSCARLLSGAGGRPHPVRYGARPSARRRTHVAIQNSDACRISRLCPTANAGSLRRYVEAGAVSSPPTKRRSMTSGERRRKDFGLADLFGVSFDRQDRYSVHNSYLNIEGDHPLVKGLENATRIVNGVNWVNVKTVVPQAYSPLTLVPSYPDLPMEEVFARVPHTDIPAVFLRKLGKGRVVYFPFDLDRTFWEVLASDHGRFCVMLWRGPWGRTASFGQWERRDRCFAVDAARFDDSASGEPHQSDDDERSGSRVDSIPAATGSRSDSSGPQAEVGAAAGCRNRAAVSNVGGSYRNRGAPHRTARSDRDRLGVTRFSHFLIQNCTELENCTDWAAELLFPV